MAQAREGDTVTVHYTGELEDGTVFDSSVGSDPMQFKIGENQLLPAFEQAVVGMTPGDSKTAILSADDAFGPYHQEMVQMVDRQQFPDDLELAVGLRLRIKPEGGPTLLVRVTELSEASVTLDANHPLAGKDLTFDIQLLDIS